MLYPRLQTISSKGQVIIPADARRVFHIQPGQLVIITPVLPKKQIILQPLASSDPIGVGFGLAAPGQSLTKTLLRERQKEKLREKAKYGKIRPR